MPYVYRTAIITAIHFCPATPPFSFMAKHDGRCRLWFVILCICLTSHVSIL